jgi:membrane associated rhomboid family serine protease/Flp pilus assembly protein TadD
MAKCTKCGRQLPSFSLGRRICEWCVRHEAMQRGEEPDDAVQPVMPVPWTSTSSNTLGFTQILVGINLLVFVAMVLNGISATDPGGEALVRWGANWGRLTMTGQWWRLITYMFLHIGIIHIALNMWCLWDLGMLCESLFGTWTFGAVYVVCGIAGGIASLSWNPSTVSAGASGAIFGLVGALIASFYLGDFSMPQAFIRTHLRSLLIFAAYSLLYGLIGRVDNAAHLGGLVTGLAFGALIACAAPAAENVVTRSAVVFLVSLMVLGGGWLRYSRAYKLYCRWGDELLSENRPVEAIADFQRAIRVKPDYVPAHLALAYAYSFIPNYVQAEAELKKVLELDPRNATAHYSLGFIYLNEQRTNEARAIFRQILTADPNSARAHFGLGAAFAAEKRYDEAIREYNAALQINPTFEGAYFNIGYSQAMLKRYDDAIAAYLKEREIADDYQTESALSDAYRSKGMQKEAADAMNRATQLKQEQ